MSVAPSSRTGRTSHRLAALLLLSGLLVLPRAARAEEQPLPSIDDAHVEAALVEAGANRAELEQVLTHFAVQSDPRKHVAARFLIANMPAHGYVISRLEDGQGNVLPFDPLSYAT